jgi:hypothetical protein
MTAQHIGRARSWASPRHSRIAWRAKFQLGDEEPRGATTGNKRGTAAHLATLMTICDLQTGNFHSFLFPRCTLFFTFSFSRGLTPFIFSGYVLMMCGCELLGGGNFRQAQHHSVISTL